MENIQITQAQQTQQYTLAQLEEMLEQKRAEENRAATARREAYEGLRADFVRRVRNEARAVVAQVRNFHRLVTSETHAFYAIMKEYGALKSNEQRSFTVQDDTFKVEVKSSKIKRFDERADVAAVRLIDFLKTWIKGRDTGSDDPMYQLAMTLLERNRHGDLDYKSISKLYDLEAKFESAEYSDIMRLFKESNVVEATAVNFYFHEKTEAGVWRKIEPSFNRM